MGETFSCMTSLNLVDCHTTSVTRRRSVAAGVGNFGGSVYLDTEMRGVLDGSGDRAAARGRGKRYRTTGMREGAGF